MKILTHQDGLHIFVLSLPLEESLLWLPQLAISNSTTQILVFEYVDIRESAFQAATKLSMQRLRHNIAGY
jgi:hypothetical protein